MEIAPNDLKPKQKFPYFTNSIPVIEKQHLVHASACIPIENVVDGQSKIELNLTRDRPLNKKDYLKFEMQFT